MIIIAFVIIIICSIPFSIAFEVAMQDEKRRKLSKKTREEKVSSFSATEAEQQLLDYWQEQCDSVKAIRKTLWFQDEVMPRIHHYISQRARKGECTLKLDYQAIQQYSKCEADEIWVWYNAIRNDLIESGFEVKLGMPMIISWIK
jgi:hypothetical protein